MDSKNYSPVIVETLLFYNNETNDMKWGNCTRINGGIFNVQLYETRFEAILDFDNYSQNVSSNVQIMNKTKKETN